MLVHCRRSHFGSSKWLTSPQGVDVVPLIKGFLIFIRRHSVRESPLRNHNLLTGGIRFALVALSGTRRQRLRRRWLPGSTTYPYFRSKIQPIRQNMGGPAMCFAALIPFTAFWAKAHYDEDGPGQAVPLFGNNCMSCITNLTAEPTETD
jgi:hypothetical protein